jgi:hypothetical protein
MVGETPVFPKSAYNSNGLRLLEKTVAIMLTYLGKPPQLDPRLATRLAETKAALDARRPLPLDTLRALPEATTLHIVIVKG